MAKQRTEFSAKLRKYCDKIGTTNAAVMCGVTPRCLRLWMVPGAKEPCRAMKVGVISILGAKAELEPIEPTGGSFTIHVRGKDYVLPFNSTQKQIDIVMNPKPQTKKETK